MERKKWETCHIKSKMYFFLFDDNNNNNSNYMNIISNKIYCT